MSLHFHQVFLLWVVLLETDALVECERHFILRFKAFFHPNMLVAIVSHLIEAFVLFGRIVLALQ